MNYHYRCIFVSLLFLFTPLWSLHAMQVASHSSGWVYAKMNYTTVALIGGSLLVGGILGAIGYTLCINNALERKIGKMKTHMERIERINTTLQGTITRQEESIAYLQKLAGEHIGRIGNLAEAVFEQGAFSHKIAMSCDMSGRNIETINRNQEILRKQYEQLGSRCDSFDGFAYQVNTKAPRRALDIEGRIENLEKRIGPLESFVSGSQSGNTEL